MSEPAVAGVFTNASLLPTLASVIATTPTVRVVVYDGHREGDAGEKEAVERIERERPGVRVVTLEEVRELGKKGGHKPDPPGPEDTCCIMYTSGSTGPPKGVIISHRNIVASGGLRSLSLLWENGPVR